MFSSSTNSGDCTRSSFSSNSYPSSVTFLSSVTLPTNRSTSGIYWTFTDDYQKKDILGSVSVTFHPSIIPKSSVSDCARLNSYSGSYSGGSLSYSSLSSSSKSYSNSYSSSESYSLSSSSSQWWKFAMNCSCGKTVSTMSYFS
jgi:hypothetical protein